MLGCAPIFAVYRYLSVADYPDARVIKRDRPTLWEGRWPRGKIPVTYEIKRSEYTLLLYIDPYDPLYPTTMIRFAPDETRNLGIKPDRGREAPGCRHWWVGDTPLLAPVVWTRRPDTSRWAFPYLPVAWVHQFDCDPPNDPETMRIRFQVVADDGTILGEESIPYRVRRSGIYTDVDAP